MSRHFSRRATSLQSDPGATAWDTQLKAAAMQEAGIPVIFLTVGDPDFSTPESIVTQATYALSMGRTRYSPVAGEPALRQAIAAWEAKRLQIEIHESAVTVFPGAQNALFNLMQCLVEEGDAVLMADPYYATYPGIVAAAGARAITIQSDSKKGFAIEPERVRRALDSSTKVLLINSPSNPTGCVLPKTVLEELASLCREEGLWLVSDEVYREFAFGQRATSVAEAGADMSRTVVVNSVSKTLAMSGWRLGWAITPPDLAQHLEALLTAQLFGTPQFTQDAVAWALQHDIPEIATMRSTYEERCECVLQTLAHASSLRCIRPDGGMFVMVDVSAVSEDSRDFAFELLEHEHIAVVPGIGFGESTRSCIRISLTQPVDVLREACQRIVRFAHEMSSAHSRQTRTVSKGL